jgi:hypothetical protein
MRRVHPCLAVRVPETTLCRVIGGCDRIRWPAARHKLKWITWCPDRRCLHKNAASAAAGAACGRGPWHAAHPVDLCSRCAADKHSEWVARRRCVLSTVTQRTAALALLSLLPQVLRGSSPPTCALRRTPWARWRCPQTGVLRVGCVRLRLPCARLSHTPDSSGLRASHASLVPHRHHRPPPSPPTHPHTPAGTGARRRSARCKTSRSAALASACLSP